MLPMPKNYAIWPAVIQADKESEMIIAPCERAFLLFEGETYDLTVFSVDGDEPEYYNPISYRYLKAVAHDGILRFSYTFEGEKEYKIRLNYQGKLLQTLSVYALYEDLYALQPLKGDYHSHSYRSDGARDPAAEAGHYREQGYDFFALTDHNRYYPGGEIDEVYEGVKTDFVRVYGEEVHTPGSVVHIVHVGGTESVADQYVHDREGYEKAIADYLPRVPAHIPEQYRSRYAMAMWSTDRIHAAGGLAIIAHPYWVTRSGVRNVNSELTRLFLTSGMFDAYELVGGNELVGINCSVALLTELMAEGVKLPLVGSSDVHTMANDRTFPYYFTVCFAEGNDNDSLIASVKAGKCVAVETNHASGPEQYHYRCYGDFRLVTYAHFLLTNYFPQRQRICQGEGVAMRQFTVGEADAAQVEALARQSADFTARFFGKKPPVLPTAQMIDFENKWRKVHLNGPLTKGSHVFDVPANRQI